MKALNAKLKYSNSPLDPLYKFITSFLLLRAFVVFGLFDLRDRPR